MPAGMIKRAAADIARRLGLLILAAVFLTIAILFACAAMAVGLMQLMPVWAALATTAGAVLGICLLLVLLAGRTAGSSDTPSSDAAPDAQAAAVGEALGRNVRQKPKTSLLLALGAGLVLGLNPGLRRDLFGLLRDPPQR